MKRELVAIGMLGVAACSSPEGTKSEFRHAAEVQRTREEMVRPAAMPVPVRRAGKLCAAVFQHQYPGPRSDISDEEHRRMLNAVELPDYIVYVDFATGQEAERTGYLNERRVAHFGIPDPPNLVLGHFDDPSALPKDRTELLRQRIFAAIDVLLPLFADQGRPWSAAANKAAQEVRDFFPIAAEPGLWPYYKAEGKEFFSWVEKNAPRGKAPLPWEAPAR